jgi:hypothetical protein
MVRQRLSIKAARELVIVSGIGVWILATWTTMVVASSAHDFRGQTIGHRHLRHITNIVTDLFPVLLDSELGTLPDLRTSHR